MSYVNCIRKISQAAGRALSDDEVRAVYERVHKAALDIKAGRASPADVTLGPKLGAKLGVGMSQDAVIQAAAERASAELVHEAQFRQRIARVQVTKMAARMQNAAQLQASGARPFMAIKDLIYRNFRGVNVESLEQRVKGVRSELLRQLQPTWDALGDKFLGLVQDEGKAIALLKELRGENSGDADAKAGAKPFRDTAEYARQWFNEAGGDVGSRDDWAFPQHHSQAKASGAARIVTGTASIDPAVNRDAWVDRKMSRIDRAQYVDDLGQPLAEPQIREFLGAAWDTISTNGINKMTPGAMSGNGSLARRHSASRQIHYKDAQSAIDDWREFGEKSVLEILYGHIDRMGRDIAVLEFMGPNDKVTFNTLVDDALKQEILADRANEKKLRGQAARMRVDYEYTSGRATPTIRPGFSAFMDGVAHLNTAAKGGGFALASLFGDRVMYQAVAHLNDLPVIQDWGKQLSLLNPMNSEGRRALQRQGLMLDAVQSGLTRFWDDFGTTSTFSVFTGKLANGVMRVTGMTALNEIPKAAFGAGLFHAIGGELAAGKNFADLADSDIRALRNYGITETDWKVWKLADLGNDSNLTPESISGISDADLQRSGILPAAIDPAQLPAAAQALRRDATVKLLGAVNTEGEFAIVTPGWTERAQFYAGLQRGSAVGEIGRAVLQFKQFPWTQFRRFFDVLDNVEGPLPKAVMAASLIGSMTLLGAMNQQVRDVLSGRDPRSMVDENAWKFWGAAFLRGGALGIYGDFLSSVNQTRYGSGPLEVLAGPTVGPLIELVRQPLDAAAAAIQGKKTHLAAQTFQDLKSFVPGGNIWYAKAALDHLLWQRVMEWLSPGYLSAVRQKTQKEYGQSWWWNPGEVSPERAPDLDAAFAR